MDDFLRFVGGVTITLFALIGFFGVLIRLLPDDDEDNGEF